MKKVELSKLNKTDNAQHLMVMNFQGVNDFRNTVE